MPLGIVASDRKLLIFGGGVLLAMLAAVAVLSPPENQLASPIPSTYSADPGGAEAAYVLLSRLHYPVRRWEEPPGELPAEPYTVLLILANPTQMPTDKERQALTNFVQNGGCVLFTGSGIGTYFPDPGLISAPPGTISETFSPTLPSWLAGGARRVSMEPDAHWGALTESEIGLYGDFDSPVVVLWKLGKGEILWWAGSTPLTNGGITRDDNLAFFLNSVSNIDLDEQLDIYWDEYFHGQRSSLWSYVRKTSLAWGFLQIGLLALAIILTFSRRSGPVYTPRHESRLSPLEFVDTLGGLYERAGASGAAVSISRMRLRALLARQLSLPSDTPDAELARAANKRLGWKDSDFADLLGRAAYMGRTPKVRPGEALEVIQDLEQSAAKLGVRAQLHPERK